MQLWEVSFPAPAAVACRRFTRHLFPRWLLLLALFLGFQSLGSAQGMVLTDLLGRSITAEPLSLDGDKLTIRRDDGRVFELSLANLIDEDQARIRAWHRNAAANPPAAQAQSTPPAREAAGSSPRPPSRNVVDPSRIELSVSRFKGATRVLAKFEGYAHQHEDWGYSLQILNRNLYPAEKIRVEYNMFARPMPDVSNPVVVTGAVDLPPIPSGRSESFRTRTAEVCKRRGSWVYNSGGELRGIWVKIYVDGAVVQEYITPESLRTEEKWSDPRTATDTRQNVRTVIY